MVYDRTAPDHVVTRAVDADVVFTNKCPLGAMTIERLPRLSYVGVLATGFNVVDVASAAARRIPVTNVPGYGTASVAQHVFALLLELAQRAGHHAATVSEGRWSASSDFCYWDFPLTELAGRTLGIVGFGEIGRAVAAIARAFGMNVVAVSRTPRIAEGIRFVEMDELFSTADVVTLHCPLTPETQGLIHATRLAKMKPTALLINTGRGPLVVEQDLADALNSGRIAGAGLDVLSVEPPPRTNPLLTAKNCLITPHIAWATRAARARLMDTAVANLRAFLAGKYQNVINGVWAGDE